jgi:hypothetical protein
VSLGTTVVYAEGTDTSVLKLPQDVEFKGPLTGAPQTAILYGGPSKPGVFVTRVKFSAGACRIGIRMRCAQLSSYQAYDRLDLQEALRLAVMEYNKKRRAGRLSLFERS